MLKDNNGGGNTPARSDLSFAANVHCGVRKPAENRFFPGKAIHSTKTSFG
jgi:hypothetical protein